MAYESTKARSKEFTYGGTEVIGTRLDTYVLKVLPEDLLDVLRTVAQNELDGQITSGNVPSQILVDGRSVGRRQIAEATRSVSLRFGDTRMLIDATRDAYNALYRVTRIQSPPKNGVVARQNFWLYLNGAPVGLMPGALSKVKPEQLNIKSVLRVVGPLVPYGRKLYWRPIGRGMKMDFRTTTSLSGREIFRYDSAYAPRFKPYRMRTIRRLANGLPGDPAANLRSLLANRPGSVEGTGQIVKRVMRRDRRYSAIHFSDGWVNYPPAKQWGKNSRDARVPSISIQLARKGQIQIVNRL